MHKAAEPKQDGFAAGVNGRHVLYMECTLPLSAGESKILVQKANGMLRKLTADGVHQIRNIVPSVHDCFEVDAFELGWQLGGESQTFKIVTTSELALRMVKRWLIVEGRFNSVVKKGGTKVHFLLAGLGSSHLTPVFLLDKNKRHPTARPLRCGICLKDWNTVHGNQDTSLTNWTVRQPRGGNGTAVAVTDGICSSNSKTLIEMQRVEPESVLDEACHMKQGMKMAGADEAVGMSDQPKRTTDRHAASHDRLVSPYSCISAPICHSKDGLTRSPDQAKVQDRSAYLNWFRSTQKANIVAKALPKSGHQTSARSHVPVARQSRLGASSGNTASYSETEQMYGHVVHVRKAFKSEPLVSFAEVIAPQKPSYMSTFCAEVVDEGGIELWETLIETQLRLGERDGLS